MPKLLKIILWFLLGVVLLTVIYYQIANWAGRRAWAEVEAELRAAGEPVTREDLLARVRRVPPEDNFCAIDLLTGITEVSRGDIEAGEPGRRRWRLEEIDVEMFFGESRGKYDDPRYGNFRIGMDWDLENWAAFSVDEGEFMKVNVAKNPEDIVARFLEPNAEAFREFDEANDRPEAVFTPTRIESISDQGLLFTSPLPHFNCVLRQSKALSLRAAVAGERRDGETLRESILTLTRFAEAIAHESALIGIMVSSSTLSRVDDPLHEVLEWRLYDGDGDLLDLEVALKRIDYCELYPESLRWEFVGGIEAIGRFEESFDQYQGNWTTDLALFRWGPSGWVERNKANYARIMYPGIIEASKESKDFLEFRDRTEAAYEVLRDDTYSPHFALMRMLVPVVTGINDRLIYGEMMRRQWLCALALERHFIANGEYPLSLEELDEHYMPDLIRDPVDEQPMRYRKTENGYVLYSVGFDGVDDGGTVNLHPVTPGETRFYADDYKGDWVWEMDRDQSNPGAR